jgi:hypothetical protein
VAGYLDVVAFRQKKVKAVQKALVRLALVAALATGSLGAAVPASATSRTVVYNTTNTGPWNHPAIRPGRILATGYSTWGIRHISWLTWHSGGAYGHGQAFGYFTSEHHITRYRAHVSLYDVKTHHGRPYFAKMKIGAHGHRAIWATMRAGVWQ